MANVEAALPWGLHDAILESIEIDWLSARATLTVRVMITERQDSDRRGKIAVSGLVFCAIDPPEIDSARHYEPVPPDGLWIGAGEGAANEEAKSRLPKVPDGCFLHWLFVHNWNRFIHICGRTANFTWLEPQPVRARRNKRAERAGTDVDALPADPLQDIVGSDLTAVTFILNYVQLQFDGRTISALTPITTRAAGVIATSGDSEFPSVLVGQISKRVATATAEKGKAVTIAFDDGSQIELSLKEHDYPGPEAVIVQGKGSRLSVL